MVSKTALLNELNWMSVFKFMIMERFSMNVDPLEFGEVTLETSLGFITCSCNFPSIIIIEDAVLVTLFNPLS